MKALRIVLGLLVVVTVFFAAFVIYAWRSAIDPVTLTGVAILLAIVTLAACFLPVRQAARVSPMDALRS